MLKGTLATAVAAALFIVTGCNVSTTVSSLDYNQECETDDQCVLIDEGDACECSSCYGEAAIAVVDHEVYEVGRNSLRNSCPPVTCENTCEDEVPQEAFCNAGQCDVRPMRIADNR